MFGRSPFMLLCEFTNKIYEQPKNWEPNDDSTSTRHIINDDDGNAFTHYDLYHDERTWEEEMADKK